MENSTASTPAAGRTTGGIWLVEVVKYFADVKDNSYFLLPYSICRMWI